MRLPPTPCRSYRLLYLSLLILIGQYRYVVCTVDAVKIGVLASEGIDHPEADRRLLEVTAPGQRVRANSQQNMQLEITNMR